ncbi:DUF3750 domain-containing protein [Pseudoalteromonas sp. NBT06-2]|uniref:DUF3750 domain-containing protein n=1 Tax=Pseudoalteromonas sp. NBT06-2 TaxID=2025950 RepID=UPI000BA521BA|nr:DUF3750 domain-containing protein [Pseudoalteromonas sp. NBT06-2]
MVKKNQIKVELRSAKIPYLGLIAEHFWFVIINNNDHKERWEVWQKPDCCNTSWGHLHQDLLPFDSAVGTGMSSVESVFEGKNALALKAVIRQSKVNYKNRNCYYYWPGPNSNTYVQTMLNKAKIDFFLPPTAIGKDYYGWYDYSKQLNITRISTLILGIKIWHGHQYELNLLSLTFGVHLKPFKIIHPFSRYHNSEKV